MRINFTIVIINQFGSSLKMTLPIIPRIGDTMPVFRTPHPKVHTIARTRTTDWMAWFGVKTDGQLIASINMVAINRLLIQS